MEDNQNMNLPPVQNNPLPSEGQAEQPVKSNLKKNILIVILALVVVIIAGGAIFYLAFASPGRVWQRFVSGLGQSGSGQMMVTEDASFSYQDNGKISDQLQSSDPGLAMFQNVKVNFGGNFYIDTTDLTNPAVKGSLNYNLASGSTGLSAKLDTVLKDKNLYLKLGDVPFIASFLTSFNNGKDVNWVKLDLNELKQMGEKNASAGQFSDFTTRIKKIQAIEEKYKDKFVVQDKVLGYEKLHGVYTIHYSNKLDKTQLKNLVSDLVGEIQAEAAADSSSSPQDIAKSTGMIKQVFGSIIDRMQISTFESWLGVMDAKIYKVKFVSSVPSLASMISVSEEAQQSGAQSDDPQVILDELNKVSYDAVMSIDEDLYDYGKKQTIEVPTGALDILQQIKAQESQQQDSMMKLDQQTLPNEGSKKTVN